MKKRTIREDLSAIVIVKVKISPKSKFDFDPMCKVTVWYSNKTKEDICTFCPEEASLTEYELLGKTAKEAKEVCRLKHRASYSPYVHVETVEEEDEADVTSSSEDLYYRFYG